MTRLVSIVAASVMLAWSGTGRAVQVATAPVAADVTDRSFSVVWEADQPAQGALHLFLDADGTVPIDPTEGVIPGGAAHPAAALAAALQGTLRVRAVGLPPEAVVYYQTETTSLLDGSTTLSPPAPPLPSVVLQFEAGWFGWDGPVPPVNDLVEVGVVAADGLPAPGAVVLVDVAGAAYPLSSFVGEAELLDVAIVDLNNLYDEFFGDGYPVEGGEVAQITVLGGQRGSASATSTLSAPSGALRLVSLLSGPIALPNAAPACSNGRDDDGDGRVDIEDPGCSSHLDTSEQDAANVCDDGIDNDGDGLIDYPADPGCRDSLWGFEAPQCDDDLDNDNDGKIDWDGGSGGGEPDPQCAGEGWRNRESKASSCGLGTELLLAVPALRVLRRRSREHRTGGGGE